MQQPIGIFDSGLGGLTVANAVQKTLPQEQIIYFGDAAHLPYGDKSAATIQAYSIKICDVLLSKNCKAILIACNSASAAAYELIKAYVGSRAKVVNVIDPVVTFVSEKYQKQKVGLIGTKQTVGSNVYAEKFLEQDSAIVLASLASPLLVPMIEEGFHNNSISEAIIHQYLSDDKLQGIKALILGCTHYPLIQDQIEAYYHHQVDVIDASQIVAAAFAKMLSDKDLLNKVEKGPNAFLVSDITPSFERAASLFFGHKVALEKHMLWE